MNKKLLSCLVVLVLLPVALGLAGVPFAWLAPWPLVLVCPLVMLVMIADDDARREHADDQPHVPGRRARSPRRACLP